VKIWGIDTYGSVFKKYHETGIFDQDEIYSYVTEGIGEDILPKNVDFSLIDGFTKVTDKDAAVYTRRLALEEGIFVGNSAGAAIKGVLQLKEHFGPDDVVVVLFHDSGSRYVGKMFNDDWMREKGYLVDKADTASALVENKKEKQLIVARTQELCSHAIERMRKHNVAQLPVIDQNGFAGAISQGDIFKALRSGSDMGSLPIAKVMSRPFPVVPAGAPIAQVETLLAEGHNAVIVTMG